MASSTVPRPVASGKVDTKSGVGFTLGLLLGAAAGGLFSLAVSPKRESVPESAFDLVRKVEQLRGTLRAELAAE